MELGVTLRQGMDQRQLLLPKMLQAIEVLQLATIDLVTRIDAELETNETLEALPPEADAPAPATASQAMEHAAEQAAAKYDDVDVYGRGAPGHAFEDDDGEDRFARVAAPSISLQDSLLSQLAEAQVVAAVLEIASFVIGSLDANGHLLLTVEELHAVFGSEAPVVAALELVRSFEPIGIAWPGPRDSMLAQVRALDLDAANKDLLVRIVSFHLEDLAANRWPKVAKEVGLGLEALKALTLSLRTIDPCPGRNFANEVEAALRADVVVRREDGEWQIYVGDARVSKLRLPASYEELARSPATEGKVKRYLKGKLASARDLMLAIEQRRETLGRVARAALERQRGFLERGLSGLVPLGMQEVADAVGVHLSTVSRAIAGKHVQTDFGVFPLRVLFDGGKGVGADESGQGGEARASLREQVKALIDAEDSKHPLSDEQIVKDFARRGVEVARRTIAKYRQELGIPSSFRRRGY